MKYIIYIFFISIPYYSCNNIKHTSSDALQRLKDFTESYTPTKTNEVPKLPVVNHNLSEVINQAIHENKHLTEKYLTLIILKLYKEHLLCCHQSYELRGKNNILNETSILYYFIVVTKIYNLKEVGAIELIPSSIAYKWVCSHPKLMKYKYIKKVMLEIQLLNDSIKGFN